MPVFLAYDGSVNGDWIARYAIRLARHTDERALSVLYVEDVSVPTPELAARFDAITADARSQGVHVACEVLRAHDGVYGGLIQRIPEGPDSYVVCGLRVKSGRRGYLAGTISERILAHRRFHTLAVRVVQPGLLGIPRDVLVPVGGDPAGLADGMALLELLAPDIDRLHVLRVVALSEGAFRRLTSSRAGRLQAAGLAYAQRVEADIAEATALGVEAIKPMVRVSDDWAKEIVIQAGRLRTGLVFMEAPRASLNRLFRFGDPIEELLRNTPCDVALYRGLS